MLQWAGSLDLFQHGKPGAGTDPMTP